MSEEHFTDVSTRPPAELLPTGSLPVSLQIFFNDALFDRCKAVSHYIAKAEGMTPKHLIGKPEACFAVVSRALTWRLDPYAVAAATYSTPSGAVGFFGSLCQAIIENSGRLVGGVKFEHFGNWEKLRGKFRIATSDRGGKYAVPDWKPEDEAGLGVVVSAQLKGEVEPRTMRFELVQAYPRNSTLWATDPRTQIQYTAVRRFATSTVPTLFMGIPFDHEDIDALAMHDVTPPRPEPEEEAPRRRRRTTNGAAAPPPVQDLPLYGFADQYGEVCEFTDATEAVAVYSEYLEKCKGDEAALIAAWDNGAHLISMLREHDHGKAADALSSLSASLLDALHAGGPPVTEPDETQPPPPDEELPPDDEPEPTVETGSFPVWVPMPDGMQPNQWHMAARAKLKEMAEVGCRGDDYKRFRQENAPQLGRLQNELRSWFNMIDKEISRGSAL